jgi:Uma2 family endonuclease
VIEIVSPGDESRQKLSFFASHGVDEVLIVDPTDRTVSWFVLTGGEYHPAGHSGLLELGPDRLAELIDWP